MQTVSVDIGSTWTKAALFAQEGDELTLVNHVLTPTTTHHLAEGFFASLNRVLNVADARPLLHRGDVTLKYSSSAKGGLAVAAMGLVPSITLESAKVTAHSAGAKIAQYYAYKLNRHDIQALEATPPDILLFTGGTDGGEESYGLANAHAANAIRINAINPGLTLLARAHSDVEVKHLLDQGIVAVVQRPLHVRATAHENGFVYGELGFGMQLGIGLTEIPTIKRGGLGGGLEGSHGLRLSQESDLSRAFQRPIDKKLSRPSPPNA